MNSKQGIFVGGLGVGGILLLAWILGVANKISFAEGLFDVFVGLVITGLIASCIITAYEVYDALEEQEASK